ncbi:outer membrane lipoprotein chaperone LolA [Imhoffiella purpurea]|uniref:Outer-membrane lipoprotein carrier protein n=1 Tax=Imhoffiella purpurea TaxID=1249627 RepID=W9VHR6_9GAMM|nr:outer membrane lipoprotein chaperone LolA [Imhoffiella purpurea]EXJ16546.1 Outer membrane lipoprotein carrier protein LolA [Imhoffiella purpurea]
MSRAFPISRSPSLIPFAILALVWSLGVHASDATKRIDDYLAELSSLEASFQQYTFNADHTQMMEGHGTLYLQRPGRFRWEYDAPNKQVIIADGKRVYLHDLDLKQVSHQNQKDALRGTPALLLANEEPIQTYFEAKSIPSTDGRDWIQLTPKQKDTDVVRIEVGFDGQTLDSLIMEDSFGQETRLNFSGARRNIALEPDLFEIDPRAVDDFLQVD